MGNHRRLSAQAQLEQLRRAREPGGGAIIDMRIDVVGPDDEVIAQVGGRWDRNLGDYDGDAESTVVVRPHVGQIPALRWFVQWMGVHMGRRDSPPMVDEETLAQLETRLVQPDEVYSVMMAGGRRSGKTWEAALFCAMYAVQFSDAIVWVVNPNDQKHDEVRRYMSALLAPDWVSRETVANGWELVNGSAIMLKSAYVGTDPDAIKEGEAHLVWMNEGQKMAKRVFVVARGAIADHSGLVMICANPPVESKDQQWVGDFAADAQAGRQLSVYHHFNPLDNPHINRHALLSLSKEVDERTFRIEVLGEFLPPADTVAYNWIRTHDGNERPMPEPGDPKWLDVTTEFLRSEEEGDDIGDLIGMDFQLLPMMGGPVFRFYAPIDQAPNRDNVVMWGVDEVIVEGDELEWCEEAKGKKYDATRTLIVGDATGEYQHSRRGPNQTAPPEWKGKGSFDLLRMGGFWNVVPPSRRIRRKNVDVTDRVRAFTSLICKGKGKHARRRLFMDPDRCPQTCKAIREWPTVHGKPSRVHPAAHLGDATSYPIVRIFPRILRSEKPGSVPTLIDRIEVPLPRPKNFGAPPRAPHPRDRTRGL
jgi:hypothetical protein